MKTSQDLINEDLLVYIEDNNLECVQDVLDEGAQVHFNFSEPLRDAVRLQYIEIAKLLVEKYKANVNIMDGAPLRVAIENSDLAMVNMLLENKANPNLIQKPVPKKATQVIGVKKKKRKNEQRPDVPNLIMPLIAIAVSEDNIQIVDSLIKYGADVTANNFCVLQCIRSPEMLTTIVKTLKLNEFVEQKSQVKNLLCDSSLDEALDRCARKVKLIHKLEAL